MEFVKKRKKGESQKTRRFWFSPEGYRIVWRREISGVEVPARYQATVRTIIPNYSGTQGRMFEMWDFADPQHRLFKVLSRAQEACERHQRLWEIACTTTGIRGLMELSGGRLPVGIPVWAKRKLPRKLLEILIRPQNVKYHDEDEECEPGPDDPTRTSDCSVSPTEVTPADYAPDPIPALPAMGGDGRKKLTNLRSGSRKIADAESSVKPAEETVEAPKKRAAKRTKKPSKHTKKKTSSTRSSSTSGGKPAKSSRKTKSKRSKN